MGEKKVDKSRKKPESLRQKLSKMKVWQLLMLLVLIVFGTIIFAGAMSGWFSSVKITLDEEYVCSNDCTGEYMELSASEYEELIKNNKSFVVLIDQGGCKTADKLRGYMKDFAKEAGIKVYRMMFEDMKETSLHKQVKYYPSVVLIGKGKIIKFLRADDDDDSNIYNNYEDFKDWIKSYF
ncbi:hypothetical protein IKD82_01575 [Candidatus Saccharibacteria bacterium]|nr:hypothetical protein [Candidatus Saccharibacteria bacterium]